MGLLKMSLPQMSFSAGIMIFFILLIRMATVNKLPKRTFLVLWDIVLLRLMLPLSLPTTWSVPSFFKQEIPSPKLLSQWISPDTAPLDTEGFLTHVPDSILQEPSKSAIPIFSILWGIGCAGLILYFGISYLRCYREFAMALPVEDEFVTTWQKEHPLRRRYRILQTDCISTPLTYGVFRPVILLPRKMDWKDTQGLNFVLLHEWTHIRHMDALRKMIFIAAVCIHWYNPLVWLMLRKANGDMEMFCDESVLRQLNGDCRASYARSLVQMEEWRSAPAVMCFGGTMTQKRIFAIMKMKKPSFSRLLVSIGLVFTITTCFAASAMAKGPVGITDDADTGHYLAGIITGTWKLDGPQTEQHLRQYQSLQDMFGTGVGAHGAQLMIQDNLAIQFWIGVGPVYTGNLQSQDSEIYTAVMQDSEHLTDGTPQITLYLIKENNKPWLVMEYMGEQLYWSREN